MRASRLVTLLFTLQRLREATAGELARELEVSERTIYRDVAALSAAGVPLFTEPGRGGGIRLVDGWRTRLDGLTAQEAAALFAVGAPQVLAELGMSAALAGAQAKLLATLPAEMREHARTVAERFHLDAPGWFHTPHQVTQLAAVAEAVWGQQQLRISYRRRTDVVDRTIEPLGVVLKAGTWYLAARSVSGARVDSARSVSGARVDSAQSVSGARVDSARSVSGARADSADTVLTYRVDRIVAAEPTGEGFTRPDGFDLTTWWADSTTRFASQMLRVTVRLRLGPRGLKMLSHVTDTDAAAQAIARAGPPDAEGRREVELDVEEIAVAASQLTGLGGEVEALDPPELRTALAAAGAALAERNAPR
ncbi:helix-turn-helix transcriptional regulator [Pseudonocardia alaniniphila]|uniref:WYL domain-containing protein n=1 Tax=Pseudonocardia alaniniphila TaxID=75291 RepID=A0ABS9TBG1_9PSEU|nr:WYL domain-containing protein [Pseudonocardia alaniniphila]MCH6165885.1 WYL domain-containing protein [Pseudonocardia alaniniphila]